MFHVPPGDPFVLLRECRTEELPEDLARRILAFGDEAVPFLMELADAVDISRDDGAYRWGPLHAIRLLVELRATAACPLFVQSFLRAFEAREDYLWGVCGRYLPKLGAPMLDATFEFLREHPEHEFSLSFLLTYFAEDDARVVALLSRLVDSAPLADIVCILTSNRHRSWIPLLVRCLEKVEPGEKGAMTGLEAARHLIELVGGVPAGLSAKVMEWHAGRSRMGRWYSTLHFGDVRPDGWVEIVPINRHTLLCPCGRLATWTRCTCGLARVGLN
jgi:hypothetical protein